MEFMSKYVVNAKIKQQYGDIPYTVKILEVKVVNNIGIIMIETELEYNDLTAYGPMHIIVGGMKMPCRIRDIYTGMYSFEVLNWTPAHAVAIMNGVRA